ncbi:aminodeoxychorismate/anthranilate synthase component II [Virgibacillus phasianinus]|uniref:Aminodeoxychorismate/anthranilate synthase component II n=1 Tax=Virgibacillus phasianinus TaxID=2017483 RepID=A0A220TYV4_9BACI|nr:aminodeoxychorismate/anthranilate synthase component II [Virgibacillus phasianinus]ASK61038.1 aminodeoxychorismate/anthranilate synthase component II [Virgibacillus phasianinus]
MILVIDNYDSFTFNLVQSIKQLQQKVFVARNDKITIEAIENMNPSHILISPGPGNPSDAGISLEVISKLHTNYPILGVCLGHQAIAQAFGGKITKAKMPMHGKVSPIHHDGQGLFRGLQNPLSVTRYHSLIVDSNNLPECLLVTATTKEGEIMALRHKFYPLEGIQAHPEAILTENGLELLNNFLQRKEDSINETTESRIIF